MQTPEWLKPGLYGAGCGAIALAVVGFSWGGWMTGGNAKALAEAQARTEVVAALTAICLDQSKRDPQLAERVALLKTTASYSRGDLIMKNGWATMPGTAEPNRQVANACADKVGV
jgi:hypothetical protein